jgi:hypothetical protein
LETENSETWFSELHPVLGILKRFFVKTYYKILNLHIKPDGWNYIYFISCDIGKITIYLLILLIILLFYNKIHL